jgi:glycosyltransferase involved in cell wall biosynthesis
VIMPVRNAQEHVGEQLAALAAQTYRGKWELVVVDNGSSDRSIDIVRTWSGRLPSVQVVDASRKRGLNRARNAGASAARGDFFAFCDADDVATPGWLEAMAAAAPEADILGGPLDFDTLNSPLLRSWRPPKELWTDFPTGYGFLPYVAGGNCAIWASVARELRWDESFVFGSSDQEFSWRAQQAACRLTFVPEAIIQLRYRARLSQLARQYFRYGSSGAQLFRVFRDSGMPRSDSREALEAWLWILTRMPLLWRSPTHRGRWTRMAGMRAGRAVGSIRHRTLYL